MPCYTVVTDEDLEAWDAFVERHPQGVHQQLSWWMRRQEFALVETGVVVAREGGRICAGAALYHFGLPHAGHGVTIAPNGPLVEAGHLGCLPDLVRAIVQEGRRRKAILIQFEAFAAHVDAPLRQAARVWPVENDVIWRLYHPGLWRDVRVILEGRSEEDLLKSFRQDTRSRIRQAIRKGYEVAVCESESDLRAGYDILQRAAAERGYGVRPLPVFLDLFEAGQRRGAAHALICRFEGETLGFRFAIRCGRGLYGVRIAHRETDKSGPVGRFLHWHCMKQAMAWGLAYYSLGAPTRGSIAEFKEGFNPVIVDNRRFVTVVLRPEILPWVRLLINDTGLMDSARRVAYGLLARKAAPRK
jgi:hypothetical protein